jgi:hypothetical protein
VRARKIHLLGFGLSLALGCSGARPFATARPTATPRSSTSVWPVPWFGVFEGTGDVSPDGRWVVVAPRHFPPGVGATLYRLRPDGPVAALDTLFQRTVSSPHWSPDSRKLLATIAIEPDDFGSSVNGLGVLDLETRLVRKLPVSTAKDGTAPFHGLGWLGDSNTVGVVMGSRLRRFSLNSGTELRSVDLPASDDSAWYEFSPTAPLIFSINDKHVTVLRIGPGERVQAGPEFECSTTQVQWRFLSFSAPAIALRCSDALILWRPDSAVLRIALDESAQSRDVLVWGQGARSIALGGTQDCVFDGNCKHPGNPRVFDASTGRELAFERFAAEPPYDVVTGAGTQLWADGRAQFQRRPLHGTPELLPVAHAQWANDERVILTTKPPSETVGTPLPKPRSIHLDVRTGRVLASGAEVTNAASTLALQRIFSRENDGRASVVELVARGQVVAKGELVDEDQGLVALRRQNGEVELWSVDGRRIGRLPRDAQYVPYLSPSQALGLETAGLTGLRLLHIATGEALPILLIRSGSRTLSVVTSPQGWFAGDPAAFSWLRFARGKHLLDAEPLSGTDVAPLFERPAALVDFLEGRRVSHTNRGVPPDVE